MASGEGSELNKDIVTIFSNNSLNSDEIAQLSKNDKNPVDAVNLDNQMSFEELNQNLRRSITENSNFTHEDFPPLSSIASSNADTDDASEIKKTSKFEYRKIKDNFSTSSSTKENIAQVTSNIILAESAAKPNQDSKCDLKNHDDKLISSADESNPSTRFRVVKRMAKEPFVRERWQVEDKDLKKPIEKTQKQEPIQNVELPNVQQNDPSTNHSPGQVSDSTQNIIINQEYNQLFCTKVVQALDLVKSHISNTLIVQEAEQVQNYNKLTMENAALKLKLRKYEDLLYKHGIDYNNI